MSISVVKRDGRREPVSFDQILARVRDQSDGLDVDVVMVAKSVVGGVIDGVSTVQLDELTVDTAASLAGKHPDYSRLAARVAVSSLHKMTSDSIVSVLSFLGAEERAFAFKHAAEMDAAIVWQRDFMFDIFGFRTLERSYLMRDPCTDRVIERPQLMFMRVALGIHCGDLDAIVETYHHLSLHKFVHATPTLFNAGTSHASLASCFLLTVSEDSIHGIFDTLQKCAQISKSAGGIGVSFSNVRASGSLIQTTGGKSAGLVPFLRVYDAAARAVDQGGGKRKGAFAAYLEPWHLDIMSFLNLKKNHGNEEMRARDLFYGLWVPDLFMRRVEEDAEWTLFCPSACADLLNLHSEAFDARYEEYERDVSVRSSRLPARKLWTAILDAQIETGTPYVLYKDACNRKSNQQNLGVIRCSNLCTEIVEYSAPDEIAVCNLASLSLPAFVTTVEDEPRFDFDALASAVRIVTRNLNRIIDRNHYPLEEARRSNLRHRPLGIGVQGLADVFFMLGEPYDGANARGLNRDIFEAIYFASLDASCRLAERDGPYESYEGSPTSAGLLQFDLWAREGKCDAGQIAAESQWDWNGLRARISAHGLRNSLLVAPMPTASTAQILGNTECFEPITSNLYVRRVLAGEFTMLNRHLVSALQARGLWTESVRQAIVAGNGSVAHVPGLPDDLKRRFKTAWEMSQRALIDLAADRAIFIDQSQSLNLFVAEPTHAKLSSMHFYGWKKGLKTGQYYLRTKPAANPIKVTLPVGMEDCSRDTCESCTA